MSRVVFLQKTAYEWLGTMYISAVLKAHGHACDILVEPLEKEDVVLKTLRISPDIVAFSCLTSDYHWAKEKARYIKQKSKALIVMGGTHITLNPNEAIADPHVDVICIGEGEYPMLELANAVEKNGRIRVINNLWIKSSSGVIKNESRDLIENLDSLPFPDRDLYAKYESLAKRGKKPVDLGRGCPFNCSFCHNVAKRKLFKDKGSYVRWRSIDNVLEEISQIKKTRFVRLIHFVDDGFGLNQESLQKLLKRLSDNFIDRPIIQANMRGDMITENLCRSFHEYGTGLLRIRIAVECGDEIYRRKILRKNLTNDDLFRAARLFHLYKIPFITYNMLGLPGETINQAVETLALNLRLKPSSSICFIFQPFPGTELAEYAIQMGFLNSAKLSELGTKEFYGIGDSRSILKQKDIFKIENLHKLFGLTIKFPLIFPFVEKIICFRIFHPFFKVLYRLVIFNEVRQRQRKLEY